jgi:hypothetical protein
VVPRNRIWRFWPAASRAVPPVDPMAGRVRHPFARHPEVSHEGPWRDAVPRESNPREGQEASPWSADWPPLTEEEGIRFHAWLNGRLAALDRERHGLWPTIRRFLFGNRLVRWLASGSRPV